MSFRVKTHTKILCIVGVSLLSACMAKEATFNEQQKRMQRCDQYIERDRELCLQGEHVTIEDYKDDYKDFKKSQLEQQQKDQIKLNIPPPVKRDEPLQDESTDEPTDEPKDKPM